MSPPPLKQKYQSHARVVPLYVVFFAIATYVAANSDLVNHYPDLPGLLEARAPVAVAFIIGALSLWFWTRKPLTPTARYLAMGFGGIVFIVGIVGTCLQIAAGNLSLHTLLDGDAPLGIVSPASSWLTPQGALCSILIGIALIFPRWHIRKIYPAIYCILLVGALAGSTLLRYIYDEGHLIHAIGSHRMRPSTAFLFILLSWGALCANMRGGAVLVLFSPTATAKGLRRILLFVLLALPILGGVQLFQQRRGWHPSELGISLLVVSSLVVFTLAVLLLGAGLIKAEVLRRRSDYRRTVRDADFIGTFEQAAVGIAHVAASGRLLRTNKRFADILGYTPRELRHLTFQEITYPEDLAMDVASFNSVLAGETNRYSTEKRYIRKDGSTVWCNLTVALLRNAKGRPKYFISVVEDISASKETAEKLVAADKAKDHFISIISHELRTPLTPVLAALSGPDPLNDSATITMMRRNIEHECSIINDLLDLTRISASGKLQLDLQPYDLHALIHEVVANLAGPLQRHRLTVLLHLDAPRHTVNADPIRLRQIFINLLDNAIKFTPAGGSITITTLLAKPKTEVQCESIEVEVKDTGVGINPARLSAIFNPFEQGREQESRKLGGLGLGLAIVKGLVEAHGGTISARNGETGAVFLFTLCLSAVAAAPADMPVKTAPPPPSPSVRPIRILIAEDHDDTRNTLQRFLERRGHQVETAGKASEALAQAHKHHFDLLISDIGLPDQSGLELLTQLRADGINLPAIAFSGFGTESDVRKSLKAGFARHLTKPIEMHALEKAVSEIIAS